MPKTISFHCGSTYSKGHNERDERYTDSQKHIDKELSKLNEIICDYPVREKYNDIFKSSVEDYNAHQSRADRQIDDYYTKIKTDKRKHPVYEVIVQIGDKDDTGNLAEKEKAVLRNYAQKWEKRNPNLKLVGAYIHADEPNGTVHAHIDFIPVAKCSRGMKLQNSFVKALDQQGYVGKQASKTAQMEWQQSEREYLEQLCVQRGIVAKANQGLTHAHLSKNEYIKAKEKAKEKIKEEIEPLRATEMAHIDELGNKAVKLGDEVKDLSECKNQLSESISKLNLQKVDLSVIDEAEVKKIPLTDKVVIQKQQLDKLRSQAKAYVVAKPAIDNINSDRETLENVKKTLYWKQEQWKAEKEKEEKKIKQEENEARSKRYDAECVQRKATELLQKALAEMNLQTNLNSEYKKIKKKLIKAENEAELYHEKNVILENENAELRTNDKHKSEQLSEKEIRISELSDKLKSAEKTITDTAKAIATLVMGNDKELNADTLNFKQANLIFGIISNVADWSKKNDVKYDENDVGISKSIQLQVNKISTFRIQNYEASQGMSL